MGRGLARRTLALIDALTSVLDAWNGGADGRR
jgi:hypothetical protein